MVWLSCVQIKIFLKIRSKQDFGGLKDTRNPKAWEFVDSLWTNTQVASIFTFHSDVLGIYAGHIKQVIKNPFCTLSQYLFLCYSLCEFSMSEVEWTGERVSLRKAGEVLQHFFYSFPFSVNKRGDQTIYFSPWANRDGSQEDYSESLTCTALSFRELLSQCYPHLEKF